jgi:pyruvate dehydrogenase E2 component (dihydrolipoamide acetyltransferase)
MPVFNASLDGANVILKKYINIGISVDTPDGATVPVIRNVDQSGVLQIATRLAERVAAARAGELSADDVEGRSFTICASGSGGGTGFTPIINAPDVAILGLAAVHIQPRWQDEKIVPRSILRLCLSWDHRVLDGVAAARFLVCVGESLFALGRLQL